MKKYQVAGAIVFNGHGNVLMVRQPPLGINPAEYWIFPGGKLEPFDNGCFHTASLREVREEAGLTISTPGRLVYTCEYDNFAEDSIVEVRMYHFTVDGVPPLLPADPDGDVLEASFIPIPQALEHLSALPWPMVREPSAAFLQDTTKTGLRWRYRATDKSSHVLESLEQAEAKHGAGEGI